MLVRCPQCRTEFRIVEVAASDKVVRYLCPGCETIVPVDLALDEVPSSSSPQSYGALDRSRTVLVADDTEETLRTAERLLREAGYRVLTAGDGDEALAIIRESHPDLVVLDLLMPGKTGFDVLREIRQDPRIAGTAVLAMSGVYKDTVLGFLHELGASGYLDKQHLATSLVFRVQGALEGAAS